MLESTAMTKATFIPEAAAAVNDGRICLATAYQLVKLGPKIQKRALKDAEMLATSEFIERWVD